MKKIGVCGHFGINKELLNGQTIKTKVVTGELIKHFGADQVKCVDSHGGAKAIPRMIFQSFKMITQCENIIIFPAHKGLRIFVPLYSFYNLFFHRRLFYVVIGGWLPEFISCRRWLEKMLKRWDGIYVETSTIKAALENAGFKNVAVMPNFKELKVLKLEELYYQTKPPYKLCTFSRVMKEKGIEDAIEAVKAVNDAADWVVYTLDIYGQIDSNYESTFKELQAAFPAYVRYVGRIPFNKSVETLRDYFALLFPTHFFTEGIPGTIIDAYAAGVPVISSRWESFADAVEDKKTGMGFPFGEPAKMRELLFDLLQHPQTLTDMKPACLLMAQKFMPEIGMQPLIEKIQS